MKYISVIYISHNIFFTHLVLVDVDVPEVGVEEQSRGVDVNWGLPPAEAAQAPVRVDEAPERGPWGPTAVLGAWEGALPKTSLLHCITEL